MSQPARPTTDIRPTPTTGIITARTTPMEVVARVMEPDHTVEVREEAHSEAVPTVVADPAEVAVDAINATHFTIEQ